MKIALTGATGQVGRFIAAEIRAAGDELVPLSRPRYRLGDRPALEGAEALVHAAFHHVPGRYRGGEGDDPEGFRRFNLDGSIRLFEAARAQGVRRVIFLSSRAVYGGYPAGTVLTEDLPPRPDTLYGQVKWQAERALEALDGPGFRTASIRATGVYGPGPDHKWAGLFEAFAKGAPIEPRRGTEVHGQDLAAAVRLLLRNAESGAFHVSDILLDRRDLLARHAAVTGVRGTLPAESDAAVSVMDCARLRALGWRPSGLDGLEACLSELAG